jgi:NADH:ubiquinone oxidoreductase subunit 5 (subunit L)/multisubunit Na+/H+ antiporter MnhA subunit
VLGFFQHDGKRLLACSTAGQLGYVLVAMGCGLVDEALLLLTFCCVNKAYIFVWFGSVMENNAGLSDFRRLAQVRLLVCERRGLFSAVAASTIAPGAFV